MVIGKEPKEKRCETTGCLNMHSPQKIAFKNSTRWMQFRNLKEAKQNTSLTFQGQIKPRIPHT